jgi:hypothetical protein
VDGAERIYRGSRRLKGSPYFVSVDVGKRTRVLYHLVYHSPTGLEWGYPGSGPADLALSILADYFGESLVDRRRIDRTRAWRLHQQFKHDWVAGFDDEWEISAAEIERWIATRDGK